MSDRAQLFIGRLNKDTRVKDLETIFAPYGRMIRCDIKYGVGTAYAFIDYDDRRDAEDAIRYENGRTLLGNRIVCEFAKGKSYRASVNSKPAGVDECYKCHRSGHWARDCPDYRDDRYGRGGGDRSSGRVKRSYSRSRSRSRHRRSDKDKRRDKSHDRDRDHDRYKRDSRSRSRRKRSRSRSEHSIPTRKRSPSHSRSRDQSRSVSRSKSVQQSRSRSKSYRSENEKREGSNEYKEKNGREENYDGKSHTSRSKSPSRSRSRSYSKSDKEEGNRYQEEEINE